MSKIKILVDWAHRDGGESHTFDDVEGLAVADGKVALTDRNGVLIRDFSTRDKITIYFKGD